MAVEQKWLAVAPQLFTSNGSTLGIVTIGNTAGFKVKQRVIISATGLPDLTLQCKRVISSTQLIVGPMPIQQGKQGLTVRADISAYTTALGAFIYAEEQDKATLKPDDIIQAVYRQEPGTTIGVELDDEFGDPFNLENPLPVSSTPMWDEIDLAYDANQNLETVTYKKAGQTVTLNLTYDANQNLTKVTKS